MRPMSTSFAVNLAKGAGRRPVGYGHLVALCAACWLLALLTLGAFGIYEAIRAFPRF